MRSKKPYIANLSEVAITRNGEAVIIEHKEENVHVTYLIIGPEIHNMNDQDIVECHNDCIYVKQELVRNYQHVTIEVPAGRPQVEYSNQCCRWTMRGDVLRCTIGWKNDKTAIVIDDQEFTMAEFGEMLSTYEGWGMRVVIVPEDETHPLILYVI